MTVISVFTVTVSVRYLTGFVAFHDLTNLHQAWMRITLQPTSLFLGGNNLLYTDNVYLSST